VELRKKGGRDLQVPVTQKGGETGLLFLGWVKLPIDATKGRGSYVTREEKMHWAGI